MYRGIDVNRSLQIFCSPPKPSCAHCTTGNIRIYGDGISGPKDEELSCALLSSGPAPLLEYYEEAEEIDYEELAKLCGAFKPRLVKSCGCCSTTMNTPEYLWPLWVPNMLKLEDDPACSPECYVVLMARDEDALREYRKENPFG